MVAGIDGDAWLRKLEVGLRTSIQTLFTCAKAQKQEPKVYAEMDSLAPAKDGDAEIGIFTPAELMERRGHADPA